LIPKEIIPARAAQTLSRLALDAGGTGNITVVIAQKAPPPGNNMLC